MYMLKGIPTIALTISNTLVGMSAFAVSLLTVHNLLMLMTQFLFMIPLFFQVVLGDSASKAGLRLALPSLSTPLGALIAGFVMSRWGMLSHLVRLGCFLMMLGNGLMASLQYHDSAWKYIIYLLPATLDKELYFQVSCSPTSRPFSNLVSSLSNHSGPELDQLMAVIEQAVSTSMVYLFRSMGAVWGVAAASTIIQNVLSAKLPVALDGIPNKEKV
jgi:hypothetical protein